MNALRELSPEITAPRAGLLLRVLFTADEMGRAFRWPSAGWMSKPRS